MSTPVRLSAQEQPESIPDLLASLELFIQKAPSESLSRRYLAIYLKLKERQERVNESR